MQQNRYPELRIRSRNELAKHISHKNFSKSDALGLINDVIANYDKYWKDSKSSEPLKNKYVRNAKRTPLGILLSKINKRVLAPHDHLLPDFIFGGITGRSHKKAGEHLLGTKRRRILLKMDIKSFFEVINDKRVFHLFKNKFLCRQRGAKIFSDICCVPLGPKDKPLNEKSIGRGFSTSPRLAVWCNLDTFIKIDRIIKKHLKGRDPKVSIYVDDIGITASRVSKADMKKLSYEIEKILISDINQKLPINPKKTDIISHEEGMEILGLRLDRNKLSLSRKTIKKRDKIKNNMKKQLSLLERKRIRNQYKSMNHYKRYIEQK